MNSPVRNGNFVLKKCPPYLGSIPAIPSEKPDNNYMFYLELAYDIPINDDIDTEPMYNGNISQMAWGVRGREKQAYGFTYDYLDRLTIGSYYEVSGDDVVTPSNSAYGVNMQYDVRGNPTSIQRSSLIGDPSPECWYDGMIDNLTINYFDNSNNIREVLDASGPLFRDKGFPYYHIDSKPYTYDANGNTIYDPSRDVDVLYNLINLPDSMSFNNGNAIRYTYDAAGNKWGQAIYFKFHNE